MVQSLIKQLNNFSVTPGSFHNGATCWDNLPSKISGITYFLHLSTMVKFEPGSPGGNVNALTTHPYTHIMHSTFNARTGIMKSLT